MTNMAVYLKGNVSEGFEAVGPFPSIEDALSQPDEGWAMTLDTPDDIGIPDGDYTLVDGAAWFTVKGFSIRIKATDEGVLADIYKRGAEADECIAGSWALDSEVEDDE